MKLRIPLKVVVTAMVLITFNLCTGAFVDLMKQEIEFCYVVLQVWSH